VKVPEGSQEGDVKTIKNQQRVPQGTGNNGKGSTGPPGFKTRLGKMGAKSHDNEDGGGATEKFRTLASEE